MHFSLSHPLAMAFTMASLFAAPMARADAGHDHGAKAAPSAAGSAQPRFAATSELFELVGVVDGKQLRLYLDRSADNSPVLGARLELELGGSKIEVKPRADGEFEATLAQVLKPGVTAVTATVIAGTESDLLAGEINVRDDVQASAPQARNWRQMAGWAAAGLLLLAALAWLARRAFAARAVRIGGAA